MFRIDTDGSVSGQFTDGNPSTGQEGTVASAEWLNETQETIARAIELAGIALAKGNAHQLYDAILAIATGVAGVGAGPGAVPTTRTLGVGGLVTGGGDLTANRSFSVPAASAADVVAGTSTSAAVTPSALAGAMTASAGANGYCRLPGGLIFQWGGTDTFQNEGAFAVTFPIEFPTACFRAIPTVVNATAGTNRDVWAQRTSLSTTGFTGFAQWTGNGGSVGTIDGVDWWAIGH